MKRLFLAAALAFGFAAATAPRAGAETAAETKDEYVKKARAAIDELGGRIEALEAKAKAASGSARADSRRKTAEFKARRKAITKDLARLKRASGKAWSDLKEGVDKSIEDLRKGIDDAAKN